MRSRIILAAALAVGLSSPACAVDSDGTRPDPVLTPGEVRTTSKSEICGTLTGSVRNVSVTTKIAARRAYGITSDHGGWCGNADEHGKVGCEEDHSIPLVIGGGNTPGSIHNIWPQRPDGPFSYHVKDRCEVKVAHDLCAGKISVEEAQNVFRGDWRINCRPWLPDLPAPN